MTQLPEEIRIAGIKDVKDWNNLRKLLLDYNDTNSWTTAYDEFYLTRLEHRYLNPINSIKDDGCSTGEGFSIMALICTLIEFLESTHEGMNYRYRTKKDPPLATYEYDSSKKTFVSFLTNRKPFNSHFTTTTATDFYKSVRCGLLHEARTKGKWTISGIKQGEKLILTKTNEIVIYRNTFLEALTTFIKQYKTDLLASTPLKEAFIRKFDNLCEE